MKSVILSVFVCLFAGALFAVPPPPPHKAPPPPVHMKAPPVGFRGHLPPGAKRCDSCGGDGWKRRWYGAKVECGVCHGRGYNVHTPPPPRAVPAGRPVPVPKRPGNPPPPVRR